MIKHGVLVVKYLKQSLILLLFLLVVQLTYADIALFELLNSFLADGEPVVPKELEKFPLLVEYYKRVLSVPQINDWVVNRDKCTLFP